MGWLNSIKAQPATALAVRRQIISIGRRLSENCNRGSTVYIRARSIQRPGNVRILGHSRRGGGPSDRNEPCSTSNAHRKKQNQPLETPMPFLMPIPRRLMPPAQVRCLHRTLKSSPHCRWPVHGQLVFNGATCSLDHRRKSDRCMVSLSHRFPLDRQPCCGISSNFR